MIRLLLAICLSIVIAVVMAFGVYYLNEMPVSSNTAAKYDIVSKQ